MAGTAAGWRRSHSRGGKTKPCNQREGFIMERFVALLAVVIGSAIVTPIASPDLLGDLQSSLDDLVAWDPGFAPFADPPPDGHEFVVGSQTDTFGTEYQHIRLSAHSLPGGVDPKGQV